ncbi:MAG: glycosyl transferase family 1 [Alteromonas sp.]|nr:glycosyl transferase family 1 [Alteromonas sp.]MAY23236.1 glycosyl transferase family 1 [Flavobacteriaceae bacterium]|tara:strand:- start:53638 stop:54705 length:1068 start_codon:yes stop_codon:yes gene_type:complete
MKKIFLESHNINNPYTGFGQFNLHLLKGFHHCDDPELQFIVHTPKKRFLKKIFGNFFKYKHYLGLRRYEFAQIRTRYDLWHSLNQNTKIEPKNAMPYILTIHDINFVEEVSNDIHHPRNQLFIEKLNRADAITYISEFAKKSTHGFFDVPKVPEYVIYNGNPVREELDTSGFEPPKTLQKKFLFSIGDFRERKNFHLLVEMMPLLKDYQLVLAGNDTRDYAEVVREATRKYQVEDQVIFAGRVDDVGKQYYLQNCEALVFPSLREGFGLPPIEAMVFGKPVFLANTTSLPEIGGEYAFYWEDFNPKHMAEAFLKGMETFRNNQELYEKELKKQAAKFDWNIAAQQYIDVYKALLK